MTHAQTAHSIAVMVWNMLDLDPEELLVPGATCYGCDRDEFEKEVMAILER